ITFDLSTADGQTIVLFGHRNWREAVEMTAHCSMKWAVFLLSLREYAETGKGRPSPNDLKIDNWN
ncbi:MAG TPA: SRPBCC domain-containing protein, partial [Leptospiraceae bacterium]|nr:SRPBCC domain-containing protein [Leptospiraceae bacterium]